MLGLRTRHNLGFKYSNRLENVLDDYDNYEISSTGGDKLYIEVAHEGKHFAEIYTVAFLRQSKLQYLQKDLNKKFKPS